MIKKGLTGKFASSWRSGVKGDKMIKDFIAGYSGQLTTLVRHIRYSGEIQTLQGFIYVTELTKISSEPGESEMPIHFAYDFDLINHRRGIFVHRTPAFDRTLAFND